MSWNVFILHLLVIFANMVSPGQMTITASTTSKFCAKSRSECSYIFALDLESSKAIVWERFQFFILFTILVSGRISGVILVSFGCLGDTFSDFEGIGSRLEI